MTSNTSHGFTLLEVMAALTILAILSVALYTLFNQSSRAVRALSQTIDADEALFLFYNQVDKDLSAAYIPLIAHREHVQNQEDAKNKNSTTKETKPTIEKLFWAKTVNNGQLETLTFLSTNSLSDYNHIHPRLTRIVYRLKEQSHSPPSFVLSRQEVYDVSQRDFSASQGRAYTILDNIRSFKISFISQKIQKTEEEKEDTPKEFVTGTSWSSDESALKNGLFLPSYVRIEVERWDAALSSSVESVFEFKIMAHELANAPLAPEQKSAEMKGVEKKIRIDPAIEEKLRALQEKLGHT